MQKVFLDVPVYRLPREEYYRQRKAFIDKNLHDGGPSNVAYEQHLTDVFGGCWDFNEIMAISAFISWEVRCEANTLRFSERGWFDQDRSVSIG